MAEKKKNIYCDESEYILKKSNVVITEWRKFINEATDVIAELQGIQESRKSKETQILLGRGYRALFHIARILNKNKSIEYKEHDLTTVALELLYVLNKSNDIFLCEKVSSLNIQESNYSFFYLTHKEIIYPRKWIQNPWSQFVDNCFRFSYSSNNINCNETGIFIKSSIENPIKSSNTNYSIGFYILEYLRYEKLNNNNNNSNIDQLRYSSQIVKECIEAFINIEFSYLNVITCVALVTLNNFYMKEKKPYNLSEEIFNMDRINFISALTNSCLTFYLGFSPLNNKSREREKDEYEYEDYYNISNFMNDLLESYIICKVILENVYQFNLISQEKKIFNLSEIDNNDIQFIIFGTSQRMDKLLNSLFTSLQEELKKSLTERDYILSLGIKNFYKRLDDILLASYRSLEICCTPGSIGADEIFPHLVSLCLLLNNKFKLYCILSWLTSSLSFKDKKENNYDSDEGSHRYLRVTFQTAILHGLQQS